MENLIKAINSYISLSEQDIDVIKELFVRKNFKKNETILKSGKVCKEFLFIQNGVIVHFTNNGDNDSVIYFSSENEFVCDFESFIDNKPSKKSFVAIEDSIIYSITFEKLQLFYKNVNEGERFGRLLMESVFCETINHIISAFTESADQRYLTFVEKFSHIQQRVPQYHVASFIGVTPQSLSRIRRKLVEK